MTLWKKARASKNGAREEIMNIVKRLARIKDSNKSGFRVSQIKMATKKGR